MATTNPLSRHVFRTCRLLAAGALLPLLLATNAGAQVACGDTLTESVQLTAHLECPGTRGLIVARTRSSSSATDVPTEATVRGGPSAGPDLPRRVRDDPMLLGRTLPAYY